MRGQEGSCEGDKWQEAPIPLGGAHLDESRVGQISAPAPPLGLA